MKKLFVLLLLIVSLAWAQSHTDPATDTHNTVLNSSAFATSASSSSEPTTDASSSTYTVPISHPDIVTVSSPQIDPRKYGAKFNNSTDDTLALQAACNDAAAHYAATGQVTVVQFPPLTTKVTGQVSCGSGVYLRGPARVHVPEQTGRTFLFLSANNCGAEGLTFQVDNIAPENNYRLDALVWNATKAGNYSRVRFKNNVIHNSDWGIAVISDAVNSNLSDVEISGNIIDSPAPYENFDGIHVEGAFRIFPL
jgi:hypothetical protein